jgi:hypothetical protein
MEKASPDNQAPIIPPTAMLASNQKIEIASLKPAFGVRGRGTIVASVGNRRYAARTIRVSRVGKAPPVLIVGRLLDAFNRRRTRRVR